MNSKIELNWDLLELQHQFSIIKIGTPISVSKYIYTSIDAFSLQYYWTTVSSITSGISATTCTILPITNTSRYGLLSPNLISSREWSIPTNNDPTSIIKFAEFNCIDKILKGELVHSWREEELPAVAKLIRCRDGSINRSVDESNWEWPRLLCTSDTLLPWRIWPPKSSNRSELQEEQWENWGVVRYDTMLLLLCSELSWLWKWWSWIYVVLHQFVYRHAGLLEDEDSNAARIMVSSNPSSTREQ